MHILYINFAFTIYHVYQFVNKYINKLSMYLQKRTLEGIKSKIKIISYSIYIKTCHILY